MKYVIAKNYLCFLALLEMVIEDSTNLQIMQEDIAEKFEIIIPQGYEMELNNIRYSSIENEYGVVISQEKLQVFFDEKKVGLRVKYIEGTYINDFDLDIKLEKYLKENKYVIFAYSYGVLYNKPGHDYLGHVALLEKVIGEDIIQIYDPGPDNAGIKEVSLLKMCDALKRKGGLYIISR